ncbi:hypothetical protein BB8028_0003g09800 [Beauveria bassiana]|uniref:Major facilitator superfamily (MFS) profile domain-containing protein n=1 Tax=Beauveria bassiana TaxID=176275 RepID=A0A2S7Y8T3_BEABA|nr:hypothetical protein BB8028_0003g09800 [Beauveria bassiana]
MNYSGLQMATFGSPAPSLPSVAGSASLNVPLEEAARRRQLRREQKKKQRKEQEARRRVQEGDVIAPVAPSAHAGAARGHDGDDDDDDDDDDDGMSLSDELYKEAAMRAEAAAQLDIPRGVRKMEQVTRTWKPATILVVWIGMMLLAVALSLDSLTVSSYQPYALSEFKSHSMLPAISTIQNILTAATKPIVAKIADASGRAEALSVSLVSIVLGFAINAASRNMGTMAAGHVFYSFGQVGIVFLQQILAADTTTLENRSVFGALLYSPPIFTAWIGGPMVQALVPAHWRWGYAIWVIVVPVVSIPLLVSIWRYQSTREKTPEDSVADSVIVKLAQADLPGLLLFVTGLVLLLLPMTLAARYDNGWASPLIIVMVVAGTACFTAFVWYEAYEAPYPILPLYLAKSRTVAAACLTEAFFFLSYYLWQPYFYSFLVVVNGLSPKAATNVMTSQAVAAAVAGLAAASVVKFTGNCKWVIVTGTLVKLVGGGLMMRYTNMDATLAQIVISQIIAGGGFGMMSIVAQTAAQSVAAHQDVANVTMLYETARAIGGAIGNAIAGSIWTRLLLTKLKAHLPRVTESSAIGIRDSLTVATSFAMGSPERVAINQSYTEVMRILLIASIAFLALSFLTSLAIENVNLKAIDEDSAQRGVIGRSNLGAWCERMYTGKRRVIKS